MKYAVIAFIFFGLMANASSAAGSPKLALTFFLIMMAIGFSIDLWIRRKKKMGN